MLPDLASTLTAPKGGVVPRLELDELWSFVARRASKVWAWVALDRATRQVVAYALGSRGVETGRRLWEAVPAPWRASPCHTDFWEAYAAILPSGQHSPGGKGDGAGQPRRAMEQHPSPTPGTG